MTPYLVFKGNKTAGGRESREKQGVARAHVQISGKDKHT